MNALGIAGQILVVIGGLIFVVAGLGLVRFPDAYSRVSAVGTAAGLGIAFVLVGALAVDPSVSATLKVVAIIGVQLATAAIGTMAIARSAYLAGSPLRRPAFNDLADPPDTTDEVD